MSISIKLSQICSDIQTLTDVTTSAFVCNRFNLFMAAQVTLRLQHLVAVHVL